MVKRLRGHDPSVLGRIEQLLERDEGGRFSFFVFGLLLTFGVFGLEEPMRLLELRECGSTSRADVWGVNQTRRNWWILAPPLRRAIGCLVRSGYRRLRLGYLSIKKRSLGPHQTTYQRQSTQTPSLHPEPGTLDQDLPGPRRRVRQLEIPIHSISPLRF